jgi:hypothetical protein
MSWNDDERVAADVPAAGSRRAEGGGGPQAPHQGQARSQRLLPQRTVFHRYESYSYIEPHPTIYLIVNLICLCTLFNIYHVYRYVSNGIVGYRMFLFAFSHPLELFLIEQYL